MSPKPSELWDDCVEGEIVHPSHAEATFDQTIRTQEILFLITILTLWCWHSLDSSSWVLSDECRCAKVSIIFSSFWHLFVLAKLTISSIGRVKWWKWLFANKEYLLLIYVKYLTFKIRSVHPVLHHSTGELGYDGLDGTRKFGLSYAKSVVYIWRMLDMRRTGTKHIVRHMQKSVVQWSVLSKFTCTKFETFQLHLNEFPG